MRHTLMPCRRCFVYYAIFSFTFIFAAYADTPAAFAFVRHCHGFRYDAAIIAAAFRLRCRRHYIRAIAATLSGFFHALRCFSSLMTILRRRFRQAAAAFFAATPADAAAISPLLPFLPPLPFFFFAFSFDTHHVTPPDASAIHAPFR